MLIDLRSYDNLGSPKYFYQLFSTLNDSGLTWKKDDVEKIFYNKIIDGRRIFDGCIYLATRINLLNEDGTGQISINPNFTHFLNSEKQMRDKFVEFLLLSVKDDVDFHNIFSPQNLSYDIVYRSVQISNSAFELKYANFKQLLLDFEVITIHPTIEIKQYIFNGRYKKLFDKSILPEIKKRKIGIEELRRDLEQRQIHGEEAEQFVLAFEKARLSNKEGIDWVAEYSVAEGFDVLSFHSEASSINDRFIEVKSFAYKPYFFWSRNEMDVARIKGENYYLYLVDRDKITLEGYNPIMIQNPYKNVLSDSIWIKEIEKYRIALDSPLK